MASLIIDIAYQYWYNICVTLCRHSHNMSLCANFHTRSTHQPSLYCNICLRPKFPFLNLPFSLSRNTVLPPSFLMWFSMACTISHAALEPCFLSSSIPSSLLWPRFLQFNSTFVLLLFVWAPPMPLVIHMCEF